MEVPDLCSPSVVSLDGKVSVIWNVEESVFWKLRYDMEVTFNIETELLIEFSLLWFSLPFINVHDVPLLTESSQSCVLWSNFNVSVLLVKVTTDIKHLSSFIGDVDTLVSE